MMAGGNIDLKKLTADELSGVVNIYPWLQLRAGNSASDLRRAVKKTAEASVSRKLHCMSRTGGNWSVC